MCVCGGGGGGIREEHVRQLGPCYHYQWELMGLLYMKMTVKVI